MQNPFKKHRIQNIHETLQKLPHYESRVEFPSGGYDYALVLAREFQLERVRQLGDGLSILNIWGNIDLTAREISRIGMYESLPGILDEETKKALSVNGDESELEIPQVNIYKILGAPKDLSLRNLGRIANGVKAITNELGILVPKQQQF